MKPGITDLKKVPAGTGFLWRLVIHIYPMEALLRESETD
jgi:hypothetical protein